MEAEIHLNSRLLKKYSLESKNVVNKLNRALGMLDSKDIYTFNPIAIPEFRLYADTTNINGKVIGSDLVGEYSILDSKEQVVIFFKIKRKYALVNKKEIEKASKSYGGKVNENSDYFVNGCIVRNKTKGNHSFEFYEDSFVTSETQEHFKECELDALMYLILFDDIQKTALVTTSRIVYVDGKANYHGGHINEYINKPIKLKNNVIYVRKEPSGHKYERHADVWYVRGHLRKLKDGKVTYVKPHIKGPNKDVDYARMYLIN